ncbi:MAG: hypothetical protein OXC92_07265 [Flavobacteriaceae bacterium]|nr:hypothetical protein [Flavobacteriaceae bacterium]MCY4216762.1 hypothetical protein [Flavobacteriaceae bacterium]MCY4266943.1 hypothetical protein [Flavobacteriaceae bacterium]
MKRIKQATIEIIRSEIIRGMLQTILDSSGNLVCHAIHTSFHWKDKINMGHVALADETGHLINENLIAMTYGLGDRMVRHDIISFKVSVFSNEMV